MIGRKLNILNLNDRPQTEFRSGSGQATHFEVQERRTWMTVQGDVAGGTPLRPDILLIDVDFREDPGLAEASYDLFRDPRQSSGPDAKPIGLILALPYIASRPVCGLAIYSAHLVGNHEASPILRNPWFLIPMGILAAKFRGKKYYSSTLGGGNREGSSLEEFVDSDDLPKIGNPDDALARALDDYVDTLTTAVCEQRRVLVMNAEHLRRTLGAMEKVFDDPDAPAQRVDPDLFLELHSPGYGVDRIQWLSLCADAVDFYGHAVSREGLRAMNARLNDLAGPIRAYDKMLEVIREQDKRPDRPSFAQVAWELYKSDPPEDLHELLRLGVLIANVHAWAIARFDKKKVKWSEHLYARLGLDVNGNQYLDLFGRRPNRKQVVCQTTLACKKLDLLNPLPGKNRADWVAATHLDWGVTTLAASDKRKIQAYLETFAGKDSRYEYGPVADLPYLQDP